MVFYENTVGHVLLVSVYANQHEGHRAVGLGSEIESNTGTAWLSEKLVDDLARKVAAALGEARRSPSKEGLGLLVRDDVPSGRARVRHRFLRMSVPALPHCARPEGESERRRGVR